MPHPKGTPKTPGSGRKVGSRNHSTAGMREIARGFVDDPVYRAALQERLVAGTAGGMEQLLWFYAYGRPPMSSAEDGDAPASITIYF